MEPPAEAGNFVMFGLARALNATTVGSQNVLIWVHKGAMKAMFRCLRSAYSSLLLTETGSNHNVHSRCRINLPFGDHSISLAQHCY